MEINNDNLSKFRSDFNKAMLELEKKYEINIKLGTLNFVANSFSAKIECKNSKIGDLSYDENEWKTKCFMLNLKQEWFNKSIMIDNKIFKIIGLSLTKKNSVKLLGVDSKTYFTNPTTIINFYRNLVEL